ncbi:conjugal transfer protein TrbJ [Escherichia coli]|uniref:conjugal transfer protein TrbJ n=1 Tax=Escherichia coli TaxID=562 RepID=UPI001FCD5486|nr:conjugal transfer protein TrbJ [Escherichia coli]
MGPVVLGRLKFRLLHHGVFMAASSVEMLGVQGRTFSVSGVFCVGAHVGWRSVSYYSRLTCLNESSVIS